MIRTVLFDTETTGLDPLNGDRVIEIAALELLNDLPTGKHFHALIDPQRDVPSEASRVHGFTNGDLVGKPLFAEVAQPLADFFSDSKLIAHNAPFDFGFLDMEFDRAGLPPLGRDRMIELDGSGQNPVPRDAEQLGCTVPTLLHRPVGSHDP